MSSSNPTLRSNQYRYLVNNNMVQPKDYKSITYYLDMQLHRLEKDKTDYLQKEIEINQKYAELQTKYLELLIKYNEFVDKFNVK